MASKKCCIGERDMIAHLGIMSDMNSSHEQASRPHARGSSSDFGASMHGDVFSDGVIVTDL
jgi:hypothetical protein